MTTTFQLSIAAHRNDLSCSSLLSGLPIKAPLNESTFLSAIPPKEGQVRVRRLIHRGAPRPVSKFLSVTLGREVHCESSLEIDAALILDACPTVSSFGEQAVTLHFFDGNVWRWHIPDFVVAAGGVREFIEIKFQRDIDAEVRERTQLLVRLLWPFGYGYRLLTEETIRTGVALKNARSLLVRGREEVPPLWALCTREKIRKGGPLTLGALGWNDPGKPEGSWIARLIIRGALSTDLNMALSSDSTVGLPSSSRKESQLWQLEA